MRRNLTFEWIRASTLRSTWGFPLMGIVLATAISVAFLVFGGDPGGEVPEATLRELLVNTGNPLAIVFTTTICAQAFGHEYRDGTMRLVLSEFPGRSRVFLAKLMVPAVIVAASVLVAAVITVVLTLAIGETQAGAGAFGLLATIARQMVLAVWWGLMVAGITALQRNLAAGIVSALVLAAVLEGLLIALLGSRVPWLTDVLPFSTATEWASSGSTDAGLAALGWVVVVVGAAWIRFLRRDA